MSYPLNNNAGSKGVTARKSVDFAAAKLVSAATVAHILEINISGSGGNYACMEHDIRGSDRSGYMLWWRGAVRVGDNTNLVQLLRPGTRPAAAVELLTGGSPKSRAELIPQQQVVPVDSCTPAYFDGDLAQALLDADEIANLLGSLDAILDAERVFDFFDVQEQSALTEMAMDAQQDADEFEAQEHAYASWPPELGAI